MKFSSFVVKIVSPCNLNCSYCYEYNALDQSWRDMPRFMSPQTARQVALRIREHLLPEYRSEPLNVPIVLHGGEPLMMPVEGIQELIQIFREIFGEQLNPIFGMQTNGILLRNRHIEMMNREGMQIGVSCDGPPLVNDIFRVNHVGRGSGEQLERVLRRLSGEPCFKTILSVIHAGSDPIQVLDYLMSFQPQAIDFLLPHGTHDRPPLFKDEFESSPYADWLIPIFDKWFFETDGKIRIRIFEEILENLCGGMGSLESLGLRPVTLLIIASDGSYEGVDTLKAVGPGEHVLGMNATDHSLDEASLHPKVTMRQLGELGLCSTCARCDKRHVCGGGYLPHRHSNTNGFANPSLYCRDLYKLISHIESAIRKFLDRPKNGGATQGVS